MSSTYFVDTSYLCELYAIPGRSEPLAIDAVRGKFQAAWTRGEMLFLPVVCILETGNHIAQVNNAEKQGRLARVLTSDVAQALDNRSPMRRFTVVDAPLQGELTRLIQDWCRGHVPCGRGLVDAAVATKAMAFKGRVRSLHSVHIWSRDRSLKQLEPDAEPDPFI